MKKLILFLFLVPFLMLAQNPTNFPYGIKNPAAPTNTTPTYLTTTSTTGLQEKIPSAYIEKTANKTSAISGYSETLYPNEKASHDALDLKLNISDLPTNLTLYPTTTASDVSGYVVMVKDIHDVRYNTTAVDVSTPTITTTDQLVSQRISDAGILIGQPGVFNITTFGNIRHLSGSGSATFYFKVFHRDSAGVETLICTSSISNPVTDGGYSEFTASGVWDDGDFVASDRIVIKSYANRIAGGSDPVYQFQFGGTSPVRTLLPVPFSVVDAGYELSANKQNSLAIDGAGTKYPTVDAVNTIDLQKVLDVGGHAELPNSGGYIDILSFNEEGTLEDTGVFSVNLTDLASSSTTKISAIKNLLDIESYDNDNSSRLEMSPLDFRLTKRTFIGGDFNTNVIFNEPTKNTTLKFPAKTVAGDYTLATTDETVNLTGDQTINGNKTFNSDLAIARATTSTFARYYLKTAGVNVWSTGLRATRTGYSIYNETTAVEALTINSATNNISINKIGDDGLHKLQIEGAIAASSSIKVGVNTAPASSSYVGSIRYRSDANNSYVDMCMQTGASTYTWVNILSNNW